MEKQTDGGPAFPHGWQFRHNHQDVYIHGMSLRDYFAAQALPAALAEFFKTGGHGEVWEDYDDLASSAYALADAMLKARER